MKMQDQIDKEKEYNTNKSSYYNMNIQIDSMNQLANTGWKINRTKKDDNNKNQVAIVSVLGNKNSGKSFILQLLTGKTIPNGYSVTTEGLSFIIPDNDKNKDDNYILIDTAGTESPLLYDDSNDLNKKKEEDKEKEIPNIENMIKDRQITDYFIQKFILEKSDIFICVVDNLTLTDQKFINRIIKYYADKKIYIVHNLKTFIEKDQVEDYIKDTLLQSLTFDLEEEKYCNLSKGKTKEDHNQLYYKQKLKDDDKIIIHLIMANEYSEAGKYYNKFTIEYLNTELKQVKEKKSFDIVENLKDFLVNISEDIFKTKLKTNSFTADENIIKVNIDKIELKDFSIDVLGNNIIKDTIFKPKYRYGYFVDEEKKQTKFLIEIELFSKWKISHEIKTKDSNFIVHIEGKKEKEIPERDYIDQNYIPGNTFSLEIEVGCEKGILSGDPIINEENGLYILTYTIGSKNREENVKEENVEDDEF